MLAPTTDPLRQGAAGDLCRCVRRPSNRGHPRGANVLVGGSQETFALAAAQASRRRPAEHRASGVAEFQLARRSRNRFKPAAISADGSAFPAHAAPGTLNECVGAANVSAIRRFRLRARTLGTLNP